MEVNNIRCQTYAITEDHTELTTLFQFSASPSPFLGTTEYATSAHLMKKSMHLKTGFLLDNQVLFLLLNAAQIEKRMQFNQSISIDL